MTSIQCLPIIHQKKIIEIDQLLKEPYPKESTIAFVDLDETIICKHALSFGKIKNSPTFDELAKRRFRTVDAVERHLDSALETYPPIDQVPIERESIQTIKTLEERVSRLFFLTARYACYADFALDQLENLSLISKPPVSGTTICIDERVSYTVYGNVIFTSGFNKGDVAKHFSYRNNLQFRIMIFVDNSARCIRQMREAFNSEEFFGKEIRLFHYVRVENDSLRKAHTDRCLALQAALMVNHNQVMDDISAKILLNKLDKDGKTALIDEAVYQPHLLNSILREYHIHPKSMYPIAFKQRTALQSLLATDWCYIIAGCITHIWSRIKKTFFPEVKSRS